MSDQETKWYDKKGLVAVLCVVFWPVGLYGLWKSNVFPKSWKIGGTLLILLAFIMIVNAAGKKSGDSPTLRQESASAPASSASQASSGYQSDPSGQQSLSVQQIFEDTTNWSGNRLFTGYVKKFEIPKDAMGQGDKVTIITVGYDNKSIDIHLNNPIWSDAYKMNDQISIQAEIAMIGKSYATGRGDVFTGPVKVMPWDASMKPKVPSIVTVDDYFEQNMKLGSAPVTLVGQVAQKRVENNQLWIQLGSSGGTVQGEMAKYKITDQVKEQYSALSVGDKVAFKGRFNMEVGGTGYFTIEEIILNPPY